MERRLVFAGFGGQGIMFMGKALSFSAMKEGKFVTWMPSYGAEVRGGTAHSMVKVSDSEIASPVVKEPDIAVVMNQPSYYKFKDRVRKGGIMLVNESMVEGISGREGIDILKIPATDMASKLGNPRIANMIMLGTLLKKEEITSIDSLIEAVSEFLRGKESLISLNIDAIRKGYEYDSCKVCP